MGNESEPVFKVTEVRKLTYAEAVEIYGDPELNVHPEEDRNEFIELQSKAGEAYKVHLGLPEPIVGMYGAFKQYEPPHEPHIFNADRLVINSEESVSDYALDASGLHVLYVHARFEDDQWVPSLSDLRQKGVTIPDLVKDYEEATRSPIDAIWACRIGAQEDLHPVEIDTGHPYIHISSGYALGAVTLRGGVLAVSLEESPDIGGQAEYKDWVKHNL